MAATVSEFPSTSASMHEAGSSVTGSSTAGRDDSTIVRSEPESPKGRRFNAALAVRDGFSEARAWVLGTNEGHLLSLAVIGVALLLLGTACWSLAGGNAEYDASLNDAFWISWGLFFDPGTQTGLPASDSASVRFVAVVFSVAGFIFNLTLLGTVVEGVRGVLRKWKEVYGRISESGHVLVLGWGDKTLFLLNELLAEEKNLHRDSWRCCMRRRVRKVVLLANRPVQDMRQEVRMHLHFEGLPEHNISYREGDPTDRTDLMKVSAPEAKDILIMGTGQSARGSDQQIIQTLLALGALPGTESLAGDVFAEMQTHQSVRVATTILPATEGIVARYAVNRMMVLRAVVPSVGYTFLDMVSFRHGNELYTMLVPSALVGVPLREAARFFKSSVVCGVRPAQNELGVSPLVFSASVNRPLEEGDHLVLLAGSQEAATSWEQRPRQQVPPPPSSPPPKLQRSPSLRDVVRPDGQLELGPVAEGRKVVIMIGCPPDFPNILEAFDDYLADKSEVHMLSPQSVEWREDAIERYFGACRRAANGQENFVRIDVKHYIGIPTCLHDLARLPLASADSALILAEQVTEDEVPLAVDSRNLTTVISLRGLQSEMRGTRKCKVVTELLDPKTQQVLERNSSVRRHGSFVYSNSLATGVFAMAAAERSVYNVIKELMDPRIHTCHISAVPVRDFVVGTEILSYHDLYRRVADMCDGVLLGWRRSSSRYPELNPVGKSVANPWVEASSDELLILRPHLFNEIKKPSHDVILSADGEEFLPGCVAQHEV